MACGKQVQPARHHSHPIGSIVVRGGEVVACGRILAPQHNVAEAIGAGGLQAGQFITPHQWPGQRNGAGHVDPPGRSGRGFNRGQAASARINRTIGA